MCGNGDFVDAVDMVDEIFYFFSELGGETVAGGVGNIYDSGSGLDYGLNDAGEIFIVSASGVFGIELHILDKTFA